MSFGTFNQSASADGTRTLIVGYAKNRVADPVTYFDVKNLPTVSKSEPIDTPMSVSALDLIFDARSR